MYLIIKNDKYIRLEYFKHKFIRFWMVYLINKIKGNEVDIVDV